MTTITIPHIKRGTEASRLSAALDAAAVGNRLIYHSDSRSPPTGIKSAISTLVACGLCIAVQRPTGAYDARGWREWEYLMIKTKPGSGKPQ